MLCVHSHLGETCSRFRRLWARHDTSCLRTLSMRVPSLRRLEVVYLQILQDKFFPYSLFLGDYLKIVALCGEHLQSTINPIYSEQDGRAWQSQNVRKKSFRKLLKRK